MGQHGRSRGRPPVADEDDLRARAIDVLHRHGYRNVTMSRIAEETGVSVRTLHRYFPAKADIVWGGLEGALDALRRGIAEVDDRLPPMDAITAVVVSVFETDPGALAANRVRLRLIASEPDLEGARPEIYRQWRQVTSEYFARRLRLPLDDVMPLAAGAAVQTAIMTGLAWWAEDDDSTSTPLEAVQRALHGLSTILSATSR